MTRTHKTLALHCSVQHFYIIMCCCCACYYKHCTRLQTVCKGRQDHKPWLTCVLRKIDPCSPVICHHSPVFMIVKSNWFRYVWNHYQTKLWFNHNNWLLPRLMVTISYQPLHTSTIILSKPLLKFSCGTLRSFCSARAVGQGLAWVWQKTESQAKRHHVSNNIK